MARFPHNEVCKNAMACVYILKGLLVQAREVLPTRLQLEQKQTMQSLMDLNVLALIEIKEQNFAIAAELIDYGMANCHVAKQVLYFKQARYYLYIQQKQTAKLYQQTDPQELLNYPQLRLLLAYAFAMDEKIKQAQEQVNLLPASLSSHAQDCKDALVGYYFVASATHKQQQLQQALLQMMLP